MEGMEEAAKTVAECRKQTAPLIEKANSYRPLLRQALSNGDNPKIIVQHEDGSSTCFRLKTGPTTTISLKKLAGMMDDTGTFETLKDSLKEYGSKTKEMVVISSLKAPRKTRKTKKP